MPPTFLASWGWLSFKAVRRSRTRSPMVFMRTMLSQVAGRLQDILLSSCARTLVDILQVYLLCSSHGNGDRGLENSDNRASGQPGGGGALRRGLAPGGERD